MHTARINFFTAEPSSSRSVVIFLDGGGVAVLLHHLNVLVHPVSPLPDEILHVLYRVLEAVRVAGSGSRGRYSSNV